MVLLVLCINQTQRRLCFGESHQGNKEQASSGASSGWGDPGKAGLFEVSTIEAPHAARHTAEKKMAS